MGDDNELGKERMKNGRFSHHPHRHALATADGRGCFAAACGVIVFEWGKQKRPIQWVALFG